MDKESADSTEKYHKWINPLWLDKWIKLFCYALVSSLVLGLLGQLDPFGLKTAADLQSESFFLRLTAPWYGSALPNDSAQNHITVVLIDDQYLEEMNSSWPMTYLDQDQLLGQILDYHPKAVFLDLLYRHKHGEDGDIRQFVDTISEAKGNAGTPLPITIPILVNDIQGISSCDPEEKNEPDSAESIVIKNSVISQILDSPVKKTYIGWTGCGNRYPGMILRDSRFKTPAFALYADSCRRHDGYANKYPEQCAAILSNDLGEFMQPMVIRWGVGVSQMHEEALKKADISCITFDRDNLWSKASYALSQVGTAVGQSLSSTSERGKIERCTYTDTVHATWFLGSSADTHTYLASMLENRIVLVGTQIAGVHDEIYSPVNGKVPGVYLFAMALDNYLEYGARYFKQMSNLLAAAIEIVVLFFIIIIMTALSWKIFPAGKMQSFYYAPWRKECRILWVIGLLRLVVPVMISLTVALVMWQCAYAPMDWIGVSLLSFFSNPISIKDCCKC